LSLYYAPLSDVSLLDIISDIPVGDGHQNQTNRCGKPDQPIFMRMGFLLTLRFMNDLPGEILWQI
jgi:hypothetical protein